MRNTNDEPKTLFTEPVSLHAETTCPNCGHCPTCGRSNATPWVGYPYWQVIPHQYPVYPFYPNWITYTGTYTPQFAGTVPNVTGTTTTNVHNRAANGQ